MTSLHYVSSTDPSHYGTIKYSMTPVVSQPCQVRVSSIQYIATFSITTNDDYIEFEKEDKTKTKFLFSEKNNYLPETVVSEINGVIGDDFVVSQESDGCLKFTTSKTDSKYKRITDASHRARMLCGMYHCDLPVDLPFKAPSIPLTSFGNQLYLVSNLPSPVGVRGNDKNKEEYRSIVYKASDFIYPNIPVNSRTPGPIITTKTEALTDLEFTLCDFLMKPVILHSPLTITIEVFYGLQTIPMLPIS